VKLVVENPRNASVCRYFGSRDGAADAPAVRTPAEVADPYYTLGTHPDLVERLWDQLGGGLPVDCRRVLYRTPVLLRPDTGIVFGFAGGTHTYALRLPEAERTAALGSGATRVRHYPMHPSLDLDTLGPEWVFGGWLRGEEAWCRAAYDFAGVDSVS
jgi:hypothetical protein